MSIVIRNNEGRPAAMYFVFVIRGLLVLAAHDFVITGHSVAQMLTCWVVIYMQMLTDTLGPARPTVFISTEMVITVIDCCPVLEAEIVLASMYHL
jgi:hypothetical protein